MKYSEELNVFLQVARSGSFAKAARALNLPTTTISRKLQQLEFELDVNLFNRTTRSLSLTEIGERLLPKATLVVETISELKGDAESHAETPTGMLHLSASSTIAQRLAPVFAEFLKRYPSIRLSFDCSSRNKDLTVQRADFALRIGPLHDSSLIAMLLAEVRYALVAQPAFLKSQAPANHPLDLIKWPSIRNHIDGLLLPWRLVHNSESFDVDPVNPLLSDDLLVSASLALCGAGLANLPMPLVKDHIARGELVSVFEQWMPPSRNLFLVYANREHLPSKSIVFIDFFKEKQLEVQSLLADTR